MADLFTIKNPLALKGGSVKVGAAPGKGQSNVGSLVKNMPVARTPAKSVAAPSSSGGKRITAPVTQTKRTNTPTSTGRTQAQIASDNAARAEAARIAQARGDYNNLLGTTNRSINDSIDAAGRGYNSSILDFIEGQQSGQRTIDSKATQNELARLQGNQDITDMVGDGIRSGGVMLANSNAGSSSATDAIARAYGLIGRQESSRIGNEFAQGQEEVGAMQDNLNRSVDTQRRKNNEGKTTIINDIVNKATSALADLNQRAAYASLPERIDIEQRIAAIKQDAMGRLSAYDATLNNGLAKSAAPDQIKQRAASMQAAGVAPEERFNYSTTAPAELQNTGDFASNLPIFVSPNKKQQTA